MMPKPSPKKPPLRALACARKDTTMYSTPTGELQPVTGMWTSAVVWPGRR